MPTNWIDLFAKNIQDYEGYSIGKLFKHLSNPDIISLAGGLPSPDTFPKELMQATSQRLLADDFSSVMNYVPVDGEKGLKEAIVRFLKNDDIDIGPDNLLITSSAQQGLDLTGRMLCDPGDLIILERPTFAGAICAFEMQKPRYAGVPMAGDGLDIDFLRDLLKRLAAQGSRPKFIYVVPEFQNPSGITMSLEKRRDLLELSYEFETLIVEDSPYRWLRFSGEDIPPIYSLDQRNGGENVVAIYTFSKLFCPGMRVGFNIGPAPLVAMMTNIKEGSTLCTPKYNQDMCTAFLGEMGWREHINKARDHYRQKAEVFLAAMDRYFPPELGVDWTRPEGGLFIWATMPEGLDTMKLFYKAIDYGVAFVPGNAFFGENPTTNQMRINFSYPPLEKLDEGVRRLAECVKAELG